MCGQELLRNKGSRARKQVKKINFIRKAKSIFTFYTNFHIARYNI